MLGHFLVAVLFFTLAQARAIVTNECQHKVWIWSIPFVGSSHTENVPIKPGGQYQEPWRLGALGTPGIAIKISTQPDGINELADEIDFAYFISSEGKSKIWVDLSSVRGEHVYSQISFHSCMSAYNSANVEPHECDATDEVELVLCGTTRTIPATDSASLEQIQACYQPSSDGINEIPGDELEYRGSFGAFPTDFEAGGSEEQVQSPQSMLPLNCSTYWYNCSACSSVNAKPSNDEQRSGDEAPVNNTPPPSEEPLVNNKPPHNDKLPVVSRCQAKVVYPARRNMRTSPTPRNTPAAPTLRLEQLEPLCQIVRKYHPDVKVCDEEAMKAYARALYPRLCEPEHQSLLMGFACEAVARELKSVYPGVTNTPEATGENNDDYDDDDYDDDDGDKRECLSNFCEPAVPGLDCAEAARKLRALISHSGARYADIINEDTENCPPTTTMTPGGRPVVCIVKLCALLKVDDKCEDLKGLLKQGAKGLLNKDIEFSIDETLCDN